MSNTLTDLKQKHDFSAVIAPWAIYQVIGERHLAIPVGRWDGVTRRIVTVGHQRNRWYSHVGLSIGLVVLSPEFQPIFSSRGGIDFASKSVLQDSTYKRLSKTSEEIAPEYISEGISIAFHPFIEYPKIEFKSTAAYQHVRAIALKIY